MPEALTAQRYVELLEGHRSPVELEKIQRYFKSGAGEYGEGDVFMGVRMGQVFALSKEFMEMPPGEIEKLLESPIHEVRAGGLKTGSTTGTWSMSAPPTSSVATSSTSRETFSTSSRVPQTYGNAAPPS